MQHAGVIETFIAASKAACQEVKALLDAPRQPEDFTYAKIGAGGDQSLVLDLKAEAIFFSHFTPFASINSEEYGLYAHDSSPYCVVLDPIDGSDNLLSCFPYYGSCMALTYEDVTLAALVCNFVNQEIYYRIEGGVATQGRLDDTHQTAIQLHPAAKVGLFEKAAEHTNIVDKLMKKKLKFRSPGAVALSLVYAFHAKYVMFIGKKRDYDLKAPLFIVAGLPQYQDDRLIIIAQQQTTLEEIKAEVIEEAS